MRDEVTFVEESSLNSAVLLAYSWLQESEKERLLARIDHRHQQEHMEDAEKYFDWACMDVMSIIDCIKDYREYCKENNYAAGDMEDISWESGDFVSCKREYQKVFKLLYMMEV